MGTRFLFPINDGSHPPPKHIRNIYSHKGLFRQIVSYFRVAIEMIAIAILVLIGINKSLTKTCVLIPAPW